MPVEIEDCVAFPTPDLTWPVIKMLEEGSKALLYFEYFGPRYDRWVGSPPVFMKSYSDLHELFYAQNGLDEEKFRTLSGVLADVIGNARAQHDELTRLAQNLPSIWSGQSAANASIMVADQLAYSGGDIEVVQKVKEQLEKAPDALRRTILPKVEMLPEILQTPDHVTHDHKTPEDVDSIISAAQGIGWTNSTENSLLSKIQRIFPGLSDGTLFLVPGIGGDIEDHCRDWLDKFKGSYEEKLKHFIDTCTAVNEAVRSEYRVIIDLMGKLSEQAYPCPQGVQEAPGTPQTPSGTPAGTPSGTPAGTPSGTPSGTPTGTNPTTTGDPGTTPSGDNPLSALTELGTQLASSGLGTQLASGLSQLVTSANEQITSTLEQLREQAEQEVDLDGDGQPDEDADGDGKPDEPGDTEQDGQDKGIELNGKEYKLEMGPDGQLRLVVSGEDGEPQNYKLIIGADGTPTLVPEESPGETDSENGESDTENPVGTGAPPGIPGVPKGTNGEDGEHQPQDYPAPADEEDLPPADDPVIQGDEETAAAPPPPPAPPVDTGAQLAEAGPL
ncbi:hypothetical protein [Nocardia carnea]|uniref:hypothetical protein n=1 Tax=Nocardia carnea TaxID=37328 RepID=UPI002458B231|nr:hypothetical protein [Nocardia carnea]